MKNIYRINLFILFVIFLFYNCSIQKPTNIPTSKYFGILTYNAIETNFVIDSSAIIKEIDDIIDNKSVKSSRSVRHFPVATLSLYRELGSQDTVCYEIVINEDKFAYIYYQKCSTGWITSLHSSWDLARLFQQYFLEQGIIIEI